MQITVQQAFEMVRRGGQAIIVHGDTTASGTADASGYFSARTRAARAAPRVSAISASDWSR